jgi:hypothetical protein
MTAAYSFVYAVTAKSSFKVLAELLQVSSSPVVHHVAETRDGLVAAISIPGDPKSGAIYAYDRPTSSMSCLCVDERESDFTAEEIDMMFPEVVRHLNTPSVTNAVLVDKQPEIKPAHRHQRMPHQKNRQQNRQNKHPQRKGQNNGTPARPKLAQVAA